MQDPAISHKSGYDRAEFYGRIDALSMAPLWERLANLVPKVPQTAMRPHHWAFADVREKLIEAGSLISAEEAERRVLILENPGMQGGSAATDWLYAGLQLILPGEVARAHRHVAAALRFVLEGSKAFTAVNGERYWMEPGDLLLTPSWTWHDHGHEGTGPFIWLDVLDLPAVGKMATGFSEHYENDRYPAPDPIGLGRARFGSNMRPVDYPAKPLHSPVFHYPYSQARLALELMASAGPMDPHNAYKLEYIDPQSGRAALPTISTYLQLIPAKTMTVRRQTTEGAILCVKEGQGRVHVGEGPDASCIEFAPHDVIVIPNWQPSHIETRDQCIVFWATDRNAQECFGFYREA